MHLIKPTGLDATHTPVATLPRVLFGRSYYCRCHVTCRAVVGSIPQHSATPTIYPAPQTKDRFRFPGPPPARKGHSNPKKRKETSGYHNHERQREDIPDGASAKREQKPGAEDCKGREDECGREPDVPVFHPRVGLGEDAGTCWYVEGVLEIPAVSDDGVSAWDD